MSEEDRESIGRLEGDDLWTLELKYDVIIDEIFGEKKFNLSAPMNGLLLLNWKRNGAPLDIRRIDITQREDLLDAFMKSPGLFFLPEGGSALPDLSPERYVDILRHCDVFEASGGVDFAHAADFCLDFLKRKGSGHAGT
jgi:HprK-related kinase B